MTEVADQLLSMETPQAEDSAAAQAMEKKAPHVIIVGAGTLFFPCFSSVHMFLILSFPSAVMFLTFTPHHRLHWSLARPGSEEG